MEQTLKYFEVFTLLNFVKWLLWAMLAVYLVFAYLMMRQTKAMTRAVSMKDDVIIRVLGIGHFVWAGLVFFLAILIL